MSECVNARASGYMCVRKHKGCVRSSPPPQDLPHAHEKLLGLHVRACGQLQALAELHRAHNLGCDLYVYVRECVCQSASG